MSAQPPLWPQGPQPQQPPKAFPTWLLVLLIGGGAFVLFGGVLASLAIFGVRKYLANAKTAEARNTVNQLGRDAAAAYETERATSHGGNVRRLCASASQPVPVSMTSVKGMKYQSSPNDWAVDAPRNAGFACLKFAMNMPQYYRYTYRAKGGSSPGDAFEALAEGDLNGDGITSEFRLDGTIGADKSLTVAPTLRETNPTE
jgi:type IV pilus assembly protein PilA